MRRHLLYTKLMNLSSFNCADPKQHCGRAISCLMVPHSSATLVRAHQDHMYPACYANSFSTRCTSSLTPACQFLQPHNCFDVAHVDIVRPLPPCRGFRYLLASIDRFTRWEEARPLQDSSATTVVAAFVTTWAASFGCPIKIVTDNSSRLLQELLCLLGTNRLRTVSYHPQTNGLVEHFH